MVSQDLGEIHDVIRSDKAHAYYVSSADPWKGERLASLVEKRGDMGVVDWKVKDEAIGGGGRIALGKSQIYVAGFRWKANGSLATPNVRSFDFNGRLLWEKTFDEEGALS